MVVHDAATILRVRERTGIDLGGVDMDVVGRNPARLLPELQRLHHEHRGQELCCVAEPSAPGTSGSLASELALNDLLLSLPALAAWDCAFTCVYDAESLDASAVAAIEARHTCADFEDAVVRARAVALPPRPPDSAELGVDRTTLGALRGFVQARAGQALRQPDRVDDFVYAVNEVVTNSLCHGEGRARVALWVEPGAVVCEVRDRGWVRDPLAGRVAPDPRRTSGRGLWLANQLCDRVQLRSAPPGPSVRVFVATGPTA